MKKILLTFSILLFLTIHIYSQNPISLKAGIIYSTFYDEKNNGWVPGFSISLNKYWSIGDRLSIGSEIIFFRKGGILYDKLKKPFIAYTGEKIYYIDIHALIDFLQIPLLLKYNLVNKWNLEFDIFAGYFIAIPVSARTKQKKKNYYIEYDPYYPFEYYDRDEHWLGFRTGGYKLNKGIDLGMLLNYNKYFIELKYTRDLQVFGAVAMLSSINKRAHILNLLVGIKLK